MKKLLLATTATALFAGIASAEEVKVGVLLGFTGPLESTVPDMAKGAMERFTLAKTPKALPDLEIQNADDKPMKLSDFKGKVVLLNFWATWLRTAAQSARLHAKRRSPSTMNFATSSRSFSSSLPTTCAGTR